MGEEMKKVKVKIVNKSMNDLPVYKNKSDAGCDIRASEDAIVLPNSSALIHTGIYTEIPEGYEVQIRSRSGLALKSGVFVLNSPGTIDAGYRNEWGVILFNTTKKSFNVSTGDRIAQAVIAPIFKIKWNQVENRDTLVKTSRKGGFGSTGVK